MDKRRKSKNIQKFGHVDKIQKIYIIKGLVFFEGMITGCVSIENVRTHLSIFC